MIEFGARVDLCRMLEDSNRQITIAAIEETLSLQELGDYQSTFLLLKSAVVHYSQDKPKNVFYQRLSGLIGLRE